MARGSKSIVLTGDVHTGSIYAVCSKEPTYDTGGGYDPNPLQKHLLEQWVWCIDELEQRPHAIVINGETINGGNKKQQGLWNWSKTVKDQKIDFMKLAKLYPTPIYWLATRGSDYHVHRETDSDEEDVADMLGVKRYSGYFERGIEKYDDNLNRVDYYLWFEVYGKLFSVTHHVGYNKWFQYRPTGIAREMAALWFEDGKYFKRGHPPTFVVRSHVHYYVGVDYPSSFGFTTPAWKYPDPHLMRHGIGGTAPHIGTIEIIIEPNGEYTVRKHITKNHILPKVLHL